EPFGGSDVPNSVTRALIQITPANYNQNTFFTPWGYDSGGLEIGYSYRGLNITASALNGLFVRNVDNIPAAFPAQGDVLEKPPDAPIRSSKDIQLYVVQMLGNDASVSFYYYHGWLELPKDPVAPIGNQNTWRNSFDRFAIYGWGQVWPFLTILGGAQ